MALTKIDTRFLKPAPKHVRRAWYQSPAAEVVLEHDRTTGELLMFEIDWNALDTRRSYVRWDRSIGLRTGQVDTGDSIGSLHYKRSPMIYLDIRLKPRTLDEARRFLWRSGIDEGHRDSLFARLRLE